MSVLRKERGMAANAFGLVLALGAIAAYTFIVYRTAWLSDDAYISFRVAENFLNGDGLRWNVAERVQPYTHPLWLFLNTAAFAWLRDGYLTWLAVSMVTSLLAVVVAAVALSRNWGGAIMALGLLCFSRAYVDYSTSGLENPLSYLLLALFAVVFYRRQWGHGALFLMSFIAGLAVLNRMDTLLFFAPALAYAWLSLRSFRAILTILAGFLPFIAWEVFSIIYYGFPFPNTAYAKLGTGIDAAELGAQGLHYLNHTLQRDPSTFVFLGIGLLVPFLSRDRKAILLSLGGLLYLVYIVKIGGDFMGGRFLALPFLLAVLLLARLPMPVFSPRPWTLALAGIALSLSQPFAPPTTGPDFGTRVSDQLLPPLPEGTEAPAARLEYGWQAYRQPHVPLPIPGFKDAHGIGDERRFYFQVTGLAQWQPGKAMPTHSYADTGRQYRATGEKGPKVHGSVGFRGFFGGPTVYIIDTYALSDPLLARLPARYAPDWRIGHFSRDVPSGYQASVLDGPNALQDQQLAEYYQHLRLITRGPLFDAKRFETIWRMNTGQFDHLIDMDKYRFAGMRRLKQADFAEPKALSSPWNAPGNHLLTSRGVEFQLSGTVHSSVVEMSLDNRDTYRVLFVKGGDVLGWRDETAPSAPGGGLAIARIHAPVAAVRQGYDAIRVFPVIRDRDEKLSIGHVLPL